MCVTLCYIIYMSVFLMHFVPIGWTNCALLFWCACGRVAHLCAYDSLIDGALSN